ncbi:hypothetical protein L3Q67_43945 [Saccharothrix sp. AJ9571]|nr:hypothetical protein L3Q67_43945 [Saccharothrix sp. AJ9571]
MPEPGAAQSTESPASAENSGEASAPAAPSTGSSSAAPADSAGQAKPEGTSDSGGSSQEAPQPDGAPADKATEPVPDGGTGNEDKQATADRDGSAQEPGQPGSTSDDPNASPSAPGGDEQERASPATPAGEGEQNEFRRAVYEQEPPTGPADPMYRVADDVDKAGEKMATTAEDGARAWAATEADWAGAPAEDARQRATELAEDGKATGQLAKSVADAARKSADHADQARLADEQALMDGEGDWNLARALLADGERQVAETQLAATTADATRQNHATAEAGIRQVWDEVFGKGGELIDAAGDAVKDAGDQADEAIGDAGEALADGVSGAIESAGELLGGPVGRAAGEGVGDAIGSDLETAGELAGEAVDGLAGTVGTGLETLGGVSDAISDGIREGDPWSIPGEVGAEYGEGVGETVEHLLETRDDMADAVVDGAAEGAEDLGETAVEVAEAAGVLDDATEALRDAGDGAVDSASYLGERTDDLIDGAGAGVGNALQALGFATAGQTVTGLADAAGDVAAEGALAHGAGVRNSVYDAAQGLDGQDRARTVYISHERYPASAEHIDEAQRGTIWRGDVPREIRPGMDSVFKVDREGAAGRRAAALGSLPSSSEYDRDEYPPAVADTTGEKSVKNLPFSDNRGAGSSMGNQINGRDGSIQRQLEGTGLPFFGDGRVDDGDRIELRTFR